MKRLLLFAALLAPGLANAATIDTGRGRLDLIGDAPSACLISTPSAASGANSTFQSSGPQSGRVTITQLADPVTAAPITATVNLALPVICNSAHSVVVSTVNGGLERVGGGTAPINGFRQFLPYTVSASWAGQTVNATSQVGPTVTINSSDGAAGQVSLVITVPGGGGPMVAGAYDDQVVIQLTVAS